MHGGLGKRLRSAGRLRRAARELALLVRFAAEDDVGCLSGPDARPAGGLPGLPAQVAPTQLQSSARRRAVPAGLGGHLAAAGGLPAAGPPGHQPAHPVPVRPRPGPPTARRRSRPGGQLAGPRPGPRNPINLDSRSGPFPRESRLAAEPGPLGTAEGIILYKSDRGAWLNAAGDHVPALIMPTPRAGAGR